MSSILPRNADDQVAFFRSHVGTWAERADEIGTSDEAVARVAAATEAARAAFQAQRMAYAAAQAATLRFHEAIAVMNDAGGDVLKQIKAKAATVGDNSIYALALISPPAAPSPAPAPGRPDHFKVALLADGSLKLSWVCDNPKGTQGTVYQVARCDGPVGGIPAGGIPVGGNSAGGGHFVTLGVVGKKRFIDTTVPAGAAAVTYQITAIRSTARGEAALFTVHLGVAPGTNPLQFQLQRAA